MRQATVTMSLPWSGKPTTATFRADSKPPLYKQIAEAIQGFAARRGVAPQAVEYSIKFEEARA